MKRVTLPSCPALGADYDCDGRLIRALLRKTGSDQGFVTYEAQAYVVDSAGAVVVDDHGWPVRTPGTTHSLSLSGLAAKSTTREAGWVKHVPPVGQVFDPAALPEGWRAAPALPPRGEPGERVCVGEQGWIWSEGEFERLRRGKAEELLQILVERELDAELA